MYLYLTYLLAISNAKSIFVLVSISKAMAIRSTRKSITYFRATVNICETLKKVVIITCLLLVFCLIYKKNYHNF